MREATVRKRARCRQLVQDFKSERGCESCGFNVHPAALHFHHLDPATKKFNIAHAAEYSKIENLMVEIDKCIVLCANCHAIRTAKER